MGFIMSSTLSHIKKKEIEIFMEMLPPSISKEVVHDVCMETLKSLPGLRSIFSEREMGYMLKLEMKHPEEVIFNYGDRADGLYFIVSGKVLLYGPSTK